MQIAKAFFLNIKQNMVVLAIYMFVFCVLQILFTEYGDSQKNTRFESTQMSLIIQDKDHSDFSKGLCDYLSDLHNIEKKHYTAEQIADELYYENIDYVLTINKGFGENLSHGNADHLLTNQKRPGSTSGYFIDSQIDQYVSLLSAYLTAGYTPKEAVDFSQKAVSQKTTIQIDSPRKHSTNNNIYFAFCYIPYILICILTVGLGGILIIFRERNLLTRLRCSSHSSLQRNIQLGLCSGIFAFICWITLMMVNFLFVQTDLFGQQGLLSMLNSFFFLLVACSITFFISMLIHDDEALNMISNIIGLGLSFLGGIYVPLEFMSPSVVMFSRLLPSYWYICTLNLIGEYTGTTAQQTKLFLYLLIQFLFAVAIFCAALVASRLKKCKTD